MAAFTLPLHPPAALWIETEDAPWGRIIFSDRNLRELATDILNELQRKFDRQKVRELKEREAPLEDSHGEFRSATYRISRVPAHFVGEFAAEEEKLLTELKAAKLDDGVFVLQVGYSDQSNFAAENSFGDFLYIFARLVKKER
jgi:hypothetical protein